MACALVLGAVASGCGASTAEGSAPLPPPPPVLDMVAPVPSYPDDGLHRLIVTPADPPTDPIAGTAEPAEATGSATTSVADGAVAVDEAPTRWKLDPSLVAAMPRGATVVVENGVLGYRDEAGMFVALTAPSTDGPDWSVPFGDEASTATDPTMAPDPEPEIDDDDDAAAAEEMDEAADPTMAALGLLDGVERVVPIGDGSYAVEASDPAVLAEAGMVAVADPPLVLASDPYEPYQWALDNNGNNLDNVGSSPPPVQVADADVDGLEAQAGARGTTIVVAVVDSGVDFGHPDLAGRSWENADEDCDNDLDDDGNGYIDDCRGWDFAADDNEPYSVGHHEHGTHVAGIIAATADPATVIDQLIGTGDEIDAYAGVSWSGVRVNAARAIGIDPDAATGDAAPVVISGLDSTTPGTVRAEIELESSGQFDQPVSWQASLVYQTDSVVFGITDHPVSVNGTALTTDDRGAVEISSADAGHVTLQTDLPAGSYALMVEAVPRNDQTARLGDAHVAAFALVEPPVEPEPEATTTTRAAGTVPSDGTSTTAPPSGGGPGGGPVTTAPAGTPTTAPAGTPAPATTTATSVPTGGGSPASTTAAPATTAPVTAAPTTGSPTTAPLVTTSPTTAPPATAAPTTRAPATALPTTAPPATGSPVTASPTTAPPVTSTPVTASPTTAPPATVAPSPTTTAPGGTWAIDDVAPDSGRTSMENTVSITGQFPQVVNVWFGEQPATVHYQSSTWLVVATPTRANAGTVDISLRTRSAGTVLTVPGAYSFYDDNEPVVVGPGPSPTSPPPATTTPGATTSPTSPGQDPSTTPGTSPSTTSAPDGPAGTDATTPTSGDATTITTTATTIPITTTTLDRWRPQVRSVPSGQAIDLGGGLRGVPLVGLNGIEGIPPCISNPCRTRTL